MNRKDILSYLQEDICGMIGGEIAKLLLVQ